jgi:predicted transcriptional regulator
MTYSNNNIPVSFSSGDDAVKVFNSLSHPVRIKIMGILSEKRQYVSELARIVNISRPLLYMHLRKLEAANLIKGEHEISEDGKAMKYYEIQNFALNLTPETLFEFSKSVTIKKDS